MSICFRMAGVLNVLKNIVIRVKCINLINLPTHDDPTFDFPLTRNDSTDSWQIQTEIVRTDRRTQY
jgi:hypothetical protein